IPSTGDKGIRGKLGRQRDRRSVHTDAKTGGGIAAREAGAVSAWSKTTQGLSIADVEHGEKGVCRPVDPIEDDAITAAQHGLPVARTPTRGDAWAGIVPGRAIHALRRAFADGQPGQRRVPDLSLFGGRPALRENILRAQRLSCGL